MDEVRIKWHLKKPYLNPARQPHGCQLCQTKPPLNMPNNTRGGKTCPTTPRLNMHNHNPANPAQGDPGSVLASFRRQFAQPHKRAPVQMVASSQEGGGRPAQTQAGGKGNARTAGKHAAGRSEPKRQRGRYEKEALLHRLAFKSGSLRPRGELSFDFVNNVYQFYN